MSFFAALKRYLPSRVNNNETPLCCYTLKNTFQQQKLPCMDVKLHVPNHGCYCITTTIQTAAPWVFYTGWFGFADNENENFLFSIFVDGTGARKSQKYLEGSKSR